VKVAVVDATLPAIVSLLQLLVPREQSTASNGGSAADESGDPPQPASRSIAASAASR
jgi:hypothetical protein